MADARSLLKQQLAKRNSAKKQENAKVVEKVEEAVKAALPSDFYNSRKSTPIVTQSQAAVIIQAPIDQSEIDFDKEMALFEQEINEITEGAQVEKEIPRVPENEEELHERLVIVDQLKSQIRFSKKIEKLKQLRRNSNIQKKVTPVVKKKKVITPFLDDSD
ncbi:hypothetical protein HDV01_003892 [Terramyces sp. JEL0728]|nr:hypothetical protein HDV01_003892 [Terramyces sp. JEL0728]